MRLIALGAAASSVESFLPFRKGYCGLDRVARMAQACSGSSLAEINIADQGVMTLEVVKAVNVGRCAR